MKTIWISSTGINFESKAHAFDWINKTPVQVDELHIFCCGEKRYTKNVFGIYDNIFQNYIKGLLPVEHYGS